MVGVARTVGARRIGGDAGGSKGSVRGNEFGVRGGENFLLVTSVYITVLLLVTVDSRLSMMLSRISMKVPIGDGLLCPWPRWNGQ